MAASMKNEFPIKTKQVARLVKDTQTEVLCSKFEDRWLVVVSQLNKFGTMVQISLDGICNELQQPSSQPSIKVLLGADEPLTHVLARNLFSQVKITTPVILTMSLKDTQPDTVKEIASLVKEVTCEEDR